MSVIATGGVKTGGQMAVVNVYNIGGKPIFVSHVSILIPDNSHSKEITCLAHDSIQGRQLSVGGEPLRSHIAQDELMGFAPIWWRLRATVYDGAGNKHHSDWPVKPPSFAKQHGAPYGLVLLNQIRNYFRTISFRLF